MRVCACACPEVTEEDFIGCSVCVCVCACAHQREPVCKFPPETALFERSLVFLRNRSCAASESATGTVGVWVGWGGEVVGWGC